MTFEEEAKRQFERLHLDVSGEAEEIQSQGLPISVHRAGLFGRLLCCGVLKDISEGGAGILIPRVDKLDGKLVLRFAGKLKLDVAVRYRRRISDRLEFVGVQWDGLNGRQISKVMKIIEKNRHNTLFDVNSTG
ncbi:PilZ domain-containing protein [Alteromonas sp. S015]|uniref:PilZ domain-containing protein n=1 Tax=Alteromonas sp. S015 TaxID=3117401 RepID=UPI002FE2B931